MSLGISTRSAALVAGIALSLAPVVAYADGKADFYQQLAHQRYFDAPLSARSIGMAGSLSTISHDSSNVMSNPAGIGFMEDAEVSVGYGRSNVSGRDRADYGLVRQDLDSGYVSGAFPLVPHTDGLPKFGNAGFAWTGWQGDVDDVADTDTRGYGLHAAYAKALSDSFSVGYGFGILRNNQESLSDDYSQDDGYRHSLGMQYRNSGLTVGSSAFFGNSNAHRDFFVDGVRADYEQMSWGVDAGVGYDFGSTLLAFSSSYTRYETDADGIFDGSRLNLDEDGDAWSFRVGVEQEIGEHVALRVGYRYQGNLVYDFEGFDDANISSTAKYNALSWGIGVKITDNLIADYGGEFRGVGADDYTHFVTISVPFSLCKENV